MKNIFPGIILLCASLTLALTGCNKNANARGELEKAASLLEKSETAPAPVAQSPQPAEATTTVASPSQQMNQAMAAYKSGNLEDTVTRLQILRAAPAISPQQRVAVNDATAAVMADIYARAAKGDAGAMQAVKQYEQMQTHSH
ncbi:hypothetical protein [Pedosphaera parvula]|uniref:Lipoprotein n=1 Tax=Pedosphaera parvula (strain Ellin514) TaxID=320771 RepID=B9XR37_PEDPL|nr:hypothetical protein [Pedosphaera parvula]EEF57733.1 hypothetical protein Cflav_PD0795 [Pedosphaera parvula Ellin514]